MNNREKYFRYALSSGALAYSSGMLSEAILGWKLDPRTTLLSELAARQHRDRRIFQATDILAGTLFIGASAVPQHRRATTLRVLLAFFGTATIADALSPLDYPISQNEQNPRAQKHRGAPSLRHRAHYLTTTLAGSAAAGICLHDWLLQRRQSNTVRKFAGPAVILGEIAGVVALASPRLLPGIVQRMQTLGFTAICLDLARRGLATSDSPRL
ncbi:DUF998 domain-containing protein [Arthrobacter sp. NIO-1057]|uniref:DUF998 domain-containing protein n=1 Tax=Arthrobacter sp. NIO-1057 TaxID=993071 RepID=UPI00071C9D31|nr:DUF998 domain-containing protein [Arthrobacter sp. NIO-1057]KSU67579.1 hypothetical protein AS038_00245 [Arthrobacter sp. NIO-1057]SCB72796.1 Protein of unknown function [Arthrobacter sp. NIO-1057]